MSKRKKLSLIPSHMPAIREALVRSMRAQMVALTRELNGAGQHVGVDAITNQFKLEIDQLMTAPLWWVSHDMFLIALDTAESHTEPREQQPPTPTGLMYFDGDFPTFAERGMVFPHVCAVEWVQESDGKLGIRLFARTDDTVDTPLQLAEPERQYVQSAGFIRLNNLLVRALKTAWALSTIPTIASVKYDTDANYNGTVQHDSDNLISRVKIVTLREQKQSQEDLIDKRTNKPYSHRFIVRGFYRNQPYGKKSALRRKQWIPPFIKGPADKPLIIKETVHVWKR